MCEFVCADQMGMARYQNKMRLQAAEPDDWFFSSVKDVYSPSYSRFLDMLQEFWPTKVRESAKAIS